MVTSDAEHHCRNHSLTPSYESIMKNTFDGGGDNCNNKPNNDVSEVIIIQSCQALSYSDLLQDPSATLAMKRTLLSVLPSYYNKLSLGKHDKVPKRIYCNPRNITENETITVQIINSTFLLGKLNSLKSDNSSAINYCAIVMFFAPWCPFCAQVAPHYNALARAFPTIDVYAIDAIAFNNLNFRFGTVAVPNIIIFHNSKPVARFNNSERTLEKLSSFVTNVTSLTSNATELVQSDYEGPVPSTPSEEIDYMLWLSYVCIILYLCYYIPQTAFFQRIWNTLGQHFGHTEQHAHID